TVGVVGEADVGCGGIGVVDAGELTGGVVAVAGGAAQRVGAGGQPAGDVIGAGGLALQRVADRDDPLGGVAAVAGGVAIAVGLADHLAVRVVVGALDRAVGPRDPGQLVLGVVDVLRRPALPVGGLGDVVVCVIDRDGVMAQRVGDVGGAPPR